MTPAQNRPTILAIDDNPNTLKLIRTILKPDYIVKEAVSGPNALKILLKEDPPDLILLDIMMPEMDGYEVYEDIRKQNRLANIPIIFVTALADKISERKGLEYGAIDYITKPFDKKILTARIETAIELHSIFNSQLDNFADLDLDYDEEYHLTAPPPIKQNTLLPENEPARLMSIDDSEEIRLLIELGLQKSYQVISYESARTALADLKRNRMPDLILLDINMPGLDGFETLARLKTSPETACIPVIILTALNTSQDELRGFQAGAIDFVRKPISIPILKARIRNQLLLDRKRKQLMARMAPYLDD